MKRIILTLLYFLLIDTNFSFSQELKIRFMDGVFDLDNDDLVEFISFEFQFGEHGTLSSVFPCGVSVLCASVSGNQSQH